MIRFRRTFSAYHLKIFLVGILSWQIPHASIFKACGF